MDLQPYHPQVFDELPDFFDIREKLGILESNVQTLGEIICAHGLHQVVGVSLLHKHFDLRPNEKLVRRYRSDKSSFMVAEAESQATGKLYPYMWQLRNLHGRLGYYPLEFTRYDSQSDIRRFDAHMAHLSRKQDFLGEFQRALIALDFTETVALSALHATQAFRISKNETLLELTDEKSRKITLDVVDSAQVSVLGSTTKTLWYFTPSLEQVLAAHCATHCYAHCHGHDPQKQQNGG